MTNFDAQGDELRGSIRPLKNNYVRMKLYIGIFVALSFSLWGCTKKQEGCDGSLKPTILVDSTVIDNRALRIEHKDFGRADRAKRIGHDIRGVFEKRKLDFRDASVLRDFNECVLLVGIDRDEPDIL